MTHAARVGNNTFGPGRGLENTNRLSEPRDFSATIEFNVRQSGTDSLAREDPTMFWRFVRVRESQLAW